SFDLVDLVTAKAGATAPALSGTEEVDEYIEKVLNEYDGGSDAKKFQIIMTQKWISLFGTPLETYNDYRRTGYPVIFDPVTMASVADGGPDGSGPVPVQSSRGYALSYPYSADELTLNNNAPAQKTITQYKIFWDN
ncbi:MAG: SusD/RagB family nutrient-binding outer membrane lipoprotein, partial [Prolixibacteraceae bacterium]|nr:SusD/RagB family nutrient-binding outer membrane lipoprotein [Prolixibacteraceae bacterium]